jgi:predicted DNA-binding transcriptional regulator YafY
MNEKNRRLTTLLAFLQRHRGATVSRTRITEAVGGYEGSDEASRKKLQRDLEELSTGGDLTVVYDASQDGYRVRRRPLTLTLDATELAALALVARMLGPEDRAGISLEALGAPSTIEPGIRAPVEPHPAVGALIGAINDRRAVSFRYRKPEANRPTERTVHPWRVIYRAGWYLVGHDTSRGDRRTFKLSRVDGEITVGDEVRPSYRIPEVIDDIREPWAQGDGAVATLRVTGPDATLIARRVRGRIVEHDDDAATIEAAFGDDAAFASFLAGFGSSVVALEPSSLRDALIAHLQAMRVAL